MQKEFIGEIGRLVKYEGVLFPDRIRVVLTDTESPPGSRSPSTVLIFELKEERAKCTSVSFIAGDDHNSITSGHLRDINVEDLWLEASKSLALQYKAEGSDEVEVANPKRGHAAAKKLADNVSQLSLKELMMIGFYYSNPRNRKTPTKAVQLGMGYGSRHTALRRIEEARKRGWVLPKAASETEVTRHFKKIQKKMQGEK